GEVLARPGAGGRSSRWSKSHTTVSAQARGGVWAGEQTSASMANASAPIESRRTAAAQAAEANRTVHVALSTAYEAPSAAAGDEFDFERPGR
ncbi:MAG: hypothetical protein WB998_04445, partial [Solirubrobacteraceae bacterium]